MGEVMASFGTYAYLVPKSIASVEEEVYELFHDNHIIFII